jgi:hypothetical protein
MRKDKVEVVNDLMMEALIAAQIKEKLTLAAVAFGTLDILSMWFHDLEGEDRAALPDELSHIVRNLNEISRGEHLGTRQLL